jgi:hypothetical protein
MQSEQHYIDDLFRKKEEAHQPDTGNMDGDWELMKGLLKPAGNPTPKHYRLQTTRRIIKYLGGFTVVTVITLIGLNTARTAKKLPATKAAAQKTAAVPANKKPAASNTVASKPVVTPSSVPPVKAAVKKTTTHKSVHRRTYSIPPAGPQLVIKENTPILTVVPEASPITEKSPETIADTATAVQRLAAFYKALQKPAQQFVINTSSDTTIIGRDGTRLTIPAQAFGTHKKPLVNGNVQITLYEYYSYEDILAARLTTTSGDQQLESGGMVNIEAYADGEIAGLKTGKRIKMEMPTTSYNEEMQLFSGVKTSIKPAFHATFMNNTMIDTVHFMKRELDENGTIEWMPEGQEQKIAARESRKIKVLQVYGDPYKIERGKKITAYFYIAPTCPLSDEEMITRLAQQSEVHFDEVKVKRLKHLPKVKDPLRDEIIPIAGDSVSMYFGQALRMKLLSPEDSLHIVAQFQKENTERENRLKLMDRYSFSIGKLGWFNCDRFSGEPGPKVLFAVNPGDGYEPTTMVSHLVFSKFRSVLPGTYKDNKIVFGRVPKDESVKIVCVGIRNGRVMACIQPLNTISTEIKNLAFEETTPEQFKQKLQTLGLTLP